jgi:hypothetical protein
MDTLFNAIRDALARIQRILEEWQRSTGEVNPALIALVAKPPRIELTPDRAEQEYIPWDGQWPSVPRQRDHFAGRVEDELHLLRHAVSQANSSDERDFRQTFIDWIKKMGAAIPATSS